MEHINDNSNERTVVGKLTHQACPSQPYDYSQHAVSVLDRTLVLLLDREESILADIVAECSGLVRLAQEEALELADFLEEQY